MASPAKRIAFLQFFFVLGLVAVVGRAAQLQLVQGGRWSREAAKTRTATHELAPRRGTIYDRNGTPLAVSQEFYRVGVATWEVPDKLRPRVADLLVHDLDFASGVVTASFRRARPKEDYLYRFAPASASDVEGLRDVRGVHLDRIYRRAYPSGGVALGILGAIVPDSARGQTGLERALDSLLRGVPGEATFLRDRSGREYESPDRLIRSPIPGHDVLLTLDAELQGIAEAGLAETLEGQDAAAGDVVLLDPRSGEVLAMATEIRRPAGARKAGAWIPAEPGSTIKPFAAAGLLQLGRARATDSVYAEHGEWRLPRRSKPIKDTHPLPGWVTLAKAIEVSSNIGATKFTLRMSPQEHYDLLRDFGFGTPTGIEVPGESQGVLKRPHRWAPDNTQPSMAQGYELEVTPLQLAAAYAALGHEGKLPEVTLIREVRDPEGRVVYRHTPRTLRQVVTPEVAAQVRGFLGLAASEGGTGSRAQLDRYQVIGKTGTARNVVGRSYANSYTSSFAGLFPAQDPLLVAVVRIVDPQAGQYYGGTVAAPLMRRMLQDALAARRSAIDRSRFAERVVPEAEAGETADRSPAAVQVTIPLRAGAPPPPAMLEVPELKGTSIRAAALALHRRGFRVQIDGTGTVLSTAPAAFDSARAGSVVLVKAER